MGWYDEFRVWQDVFPFNCLENIVMPHGDDSGMWLPDVAVTTADAFYELPKSYQYPIRLHSHGKVDFAPGGFIRFQCKMNLNLFPFDDMKCSARVESWFYTNEHQIYNREVSGVVVYNFTEHEQWRFDGHAFAFEQVHRSISNKSHEVIDFKIFLSRKPQYYMMNIIIPSVLLSTLQLVTFIIPPNQSIRIEVSFICLLAYTMFQSMIQADLPKSSDQSPLLLIFLTLMIAYIAIAITLQCIVLTMTYKSIVGSKVPNFILEIIEGELGMADMLEGHVPAQQSNDQEEEILQEIQDKHHPTAPPILKSKRKRKNAKIWKNLYVKTDLVASLLYFALIVSTCVAILSIVPAAA